MLSGRRTEKGRSLWRRAVVRDVEEAEEDGIMEEVLVGDGGGVSRGGREDAVTTDLFSHLSRKRNETHNTCGRKH
jgi:hypothetical protein